MKILHYSVIIMMMALLADSLQASNNEETVNGTETDMAMQEAMKRGAPGEHHKALEPFAGRFTTTVKMWVHPESAPEESTGSAEHMWVLGGRFLKMDVQGDMGDQNFEGLGYLGYDNIRETYTAIWLDNMNTGIASAQGAFDSATKTYTENGTFSCSMTGEKEMPFRGKWQVIDDETLSYTMYHTSADGNEVKGMEITYKRVE